MVFLLLAWSLAYNMPELTGRPLIRGALEGNHVYTTGLRGKAEGVFGVSGGGMILIFRQDIWGEKVPTALDPQNAVGGPEPALLRWQLIGKKYHYVQYRIFADNFIGSRASAATLSAFPLPLLEAVYADDINLFEHQQRHREFCSRAYDYWGGLGTRSSANYFESPAIQSQIFFDIWARGSKLWEVYLTEPHKGNRLTREDFHPEREKGSEAEQKRIWEKVGEWTFDWAGPFYVTACGDDRYFVTDTGRVFVAPRAAKPGTPLKELWKGPPVEALIHDDDAKTWYGFTKDQYFEIADPIVPKPHSIAIRREWTANKALETAVLCGRVIRKLPPPVVTERSWDDLALPESRFSPRTIWAMTNEPARAVALFTERLKSVQSPPAKELAALIDDLGAESFPKREAAQNRLRGFGHTVEPAVREASTTGNPERKRRLKQLLTEWQSADSRTPDEVRALRAVRVLERIGSPDARRLLQEWAKGVDAAILTREARKLLAQFSASTPGRP